ncbi:hypothetical protein [Natrialba sp. INN-245]|nr:hypothetical protein [Natrialba sp. INN-245]MWV39715.1 hypothetical protein [Natrialba sp. INN-245]
MYITIKQKFVAIVTGSLLWVVFLLFSPWWLAFIALFAMVPFFWKILRS